MKRYWFCAVPAFLLLCGLGYFEIFGLPDFLPAEFLRYALLGICALFILLIFLIGYRRGVEIRSGRNIFGAVCAALLAIGIVLRSVYNIYSIFYLKRTDLFGTLFAKRPVFGLIEPVLGLLAAFVLFAYAGSELFGLNIFEKAPLLAVIPPFWYCLGVVLHFVSKIATASTAENSVEVLAVVFTLLFLFEQAKHFAGVGNMRTPKRMMQYGTAGLVFLIVSVLQYAAERHFIGTTHSSFEIPTHLLNVLFALYLFSHMIVLRKGEKEPKKVKSDSEKTQKENAAD